VAALTFSWNDFAVTAKVFAAAPPPETPSEARLIEGAKKEGKLAFWINGWTANEFGADVRQISPEISVLECRILARLGGFAAASKNDVRSAGWNSKR
jgi:hypothetical protein